MKEILKNPRDKVICVDVDGTLCHGEFWKDEVVQPRKEIIDLVQKLYIQGAHIIIYTARQPKLYAKTLGWLITNEVPFHGIAMFVKPGADLYLDDKVLNVNEL